MVISSRQSIFEKQEWHADDADWADLRRSAGIRPIRVIRVLFPALL